ncbi:ELKS/Rab6-interacting/CAST family member 1-like [Anoplophora glabripennis]|uniref:ELKS/Rab6-interacting/CAST family member 1-like n=1 Tax=Anoplophora glabripennis TaxID=217634 RepID=UPI000C759DDE|nr:ELKS/Rab6-interacting/CAST family member 1-like [Anoplophora glabripennis]
MGDYEREQERLNKLMLQCLQEESDEEKVDDLDEDLGEDRIEERVENSDTEQEISDSEIEDVTTVTEKRTGQHDFHVEHVARETLCNELQNTLANLTTEKNDLMKKFETTLQELETLKKLNAASPVIPTSCKEEIEALELEIKVMRSGNLSPEQEAEVIRKEVDVLKKYCMKLKSVENENEKLKLERDTLKSQVILSDDPGNEKRKSVKDNLNRQVAGILGDTEEKHKVKVDSLKDVTETLNNTDTSKVDNLYLNENQAYIDELNSKLKNMEELVRERDMLANKVQRLEKELLQYRDLPEDIDVYRNRSKMLDSALEERDKMSKKVEQLKEMEDELNQLKKKSSRVDQLEEELKLYSKNDKNIGSELKKATSRCTCLEKELENVKMERDSMRTRIEYMKKEIDILRAKSKESEVFRVERDKLQLRVNELTLIQVQYENLLLKCKCLEHAAAEKEMYKYKYEEVLSKECQGDMLRSQVEAAKGLERERNALVKQVGDLESCICDQEEEIKKLMSQIDNLSRNKDDCQCRMREALANMRAEIEKKDCLIAESEEKLAGVQAQLKSSIQGVSCETTCYKTRIEDLERELSKAQSQIETLKKQLNKNDSSLKGVEKLTRSECESVATMKRELDAAKEENKKLRDIANKMVTLTGDEHVQNMLKQSQCAVKRVVEELGRQYKEWDNMKRNQKKGIFAQVNKRCPCKYKHVDPHHQSDSENEKLIEELEDIQREKDKLEQIVKQIQNDKSCEGPQNELKSLRADNAKLQELLKKEQSEREVEL